MIKSVLKVGILGAPILWSSAAAAQTPVSLAQLQHVEFGIVPPNPTRCAISANGRLSGDCVGSGSPGEIEVTGEPHFAYNVSVTSLGWVGDIVFRPSLNSKRFSLDRQGRDVFTVTGDLRFKPSTTHKGTFVLNYIISVDYQ